VNTFVTEPISNTVCPSGIRSSSRAIFPYPMTSDSSENRRPTASPTFRVERTY
jgi:hypothetical protein